MTIADTSAQDVQLAPKSARRRWIIAGGASLVVLTVAALFVPAMARWLRAEASVLRERLRLATVGYGDLVRDVSIEGRVVAAVSPTLFAAADGTITAAAVS
jgi:HlyD family secretion protein